MNVNYKQKYQELKLKLKETADLAFRLGVEQGLQQAQLQQAQQDKADAQAAQAAQNGMPGQPGQPGEDPNAQMEPGQESDGSELDQHIGQLESMLQKTEKDSEQYAMLKKSLDGIKAHQSEVRNKYEMKKAEKTILAIGKAMKPAFTLGKAATKNMSEPAKKALSKQEQIVEDLMKSMADEEQKALQQINKTLDLEQLLKKV